MAISVTHSFTSPKADGTDSTLVNPSNWNAQHVTTLAQGNVLGRALGTNGAMQELPLSVDASLQSLTPPVGTTAQRPVTPTSGMMRYNTTTARVEAYQGGIWINYAGALVSTTTPGSPQNGDLWYNPTTALFQIYSGSSWVASATNPAAVAFTGGTMAGVAVTGGSDNNTPIGQTTPAAGSFTTFGAESLLPVLTTGTLTAYLVAMTPVLTVAPPYLALSVVFHATSGAAPTLDFGAGAKPLAVRGVSGLAAPPTGSLKIGSTVTMVYDGTNCVILDQQFALNGDTTSVGIPVDPAFTNAAISTAIAAIPAPTLGTLLGTLTTTSGTVQTLSGLTLTPYSQLFIVVNGVSFTITANLTFNGKAVSNSLASSLDGFYGIIWVDLVSGMFSGNIANSSTAAGGAVSAAAFAWNGTYTTATTSISFAGGTFDAGSIAVYGRK